MRALVLEHFEWNPATLYLEVLSARGFEVDVATLDRGDPLPDWRDYDVMVAMGGAMSVFEEDEHPWLVEEKRAIREAVEASMPYFGVCLGSQLLAEALGGRVYRGPDPEIGLHPIVLSEDAARDPVFGGFPAGLDVFEFHQDHFDLPPGAVRLAGSPRYPNQAYRLGGVAYAMQCHLEVSVEEVHAWVRLAPGLAGTIEQRLGSGALERFLASYGERVPFVQGTGRQLFRRFLEHALTFGRLRGAARPAAAPPRPAVWRGALVGRGRECERVEALAAAARGGHAGALFVSGAAGSGRSSLLAHAAARADGMRVLRASARPSPELPFALLADLLAPLAERIAGLPRAQASTLRSALGLEPVSGRADRIATYAAALALLALVAESEPLLLLVDESERCDEPSAEAIAFLGDRLGVERVGVIVAGLPLDSRFAAFEQLPLPPLDAAASRAVVTADSVLSPAAVDLVVAAARGNPLALRELPAALPEAGEPPAAGLAENLSVERVWLDRLAHMSARARADLLCDALDADGPRLAGDEVIASGLVDVIAGHLQFRHPLVRDVVVYAAGEDERAAAHHALAVSASDPDLRVWHAAAAAGAPDETLAAALDDIAQRAAARTAWTIAARASERAARLSADAAERARRLTAAGEAAFAAGHALAALDHLDEALALADDGAVRSRVEQLRGRVAARTGSAKDAMKRLVLAAEASAQPERRSLLLADAVIPALRSGRPAEAVQLARRAMAGAEPGGEAELTATVALATALALSGESSEATLLAQRAADRVEAGEMDDLLLAGYAGSALRLVGDHARARTLLGATVDHARRTGALGLVPYALVRLAGVELDTGGWERAAAMAAESLRLARDAGRGADAGLALGLLAWIAAARGDLAGCANALAEARELAHRLGAGSQFDYAATAEGLLQLGAGNAAAAVADLANLEAEQATQGWSDAAARPHIAPDLVEALARSGLTAEAEEVLGRFDEDATRSARPSALAAAHRARLSLCPEHQVDQVLLDAVAHADAARDPFERARALLRAGERLAGSGRAAEAESPLAAALHGFAQLGAGPFASQTQAALRAAGLPAPQIRLNPLARLGRDHLAVVVASAEGASISELAERLALGPRTVERLLADALDMLGVTEANALAPLLAASPVDSRPEVVENTRDGEVGDTPGTFAAREALLE
ncbi:MAG: hypothetical protein QOK36_1438 [Gaiellales bacterium]|nr:hypothetical protein [Gaiellales bacterium]